MRNFFCKAKRARALVTDHWSSGWDLVLSSPQPGLSLWELQSCEHSRQGCPGLESPFRPALLWDQPIQCYSELWAGECLPWPEHPEKHLLKEHRLLSLMTSHHSGPGLPWLQTLLRPHGGPPTHLPRAPNCRFTGAAQTPGKGASPEHRQGLNCGSFYMREGQIN